MPDAELSLYDTLIAWYTSKSAGVHMVALGVALLLLLVELVGFVVNPPYMMKLASPTSSNIAGYTAYSPTIWLAGVFTGLVFFFIIRYSHVNRMRERASRFAETFILPRWMQYVVVDITFLTIAVEIYLIAATKVTISSLSRDQAIAHPTLYLIGGLAASAVVFVITDLKRLPRFVRLSLTLWVAILSHIFWWVTP